MLRLQSLPLYSIAKPAALCGKKVNGLRTETEQQKRKRKRRQGLNKIRRKSRFSPHPLLREKVKRQSGEFIVSVSVFSLRWWVFGFACEEQ
ncbi:hypothetical protein V6N12_043648 [Hibiscus sabdariffa]|uniref:Uncharacterized protein n=1 Tax=Hibiscus sabdariffa TaxID=183260 RepID=A0ABR2DHU6_9ROSI